MIGGLASTPVSVSYPCLTGWSMKVILTSQRKMTLKEIELIPFFSRYHPGTQFGKSLSLKINYSLIFM